MKNQELSFLNLAKIGKNEWWQYLSTFLLILVGIIIGNLPITKIALNKGNSDIATWGLDTNYAFFLLVLPFAWGVFGLLIGVKFVHNRPLHTLIHGKYANMDGLETIVDAPLDKKEQSKGIRWERFFYGAGVWLFFTIIMELINYSQHPEGYELVFQPTPFFVGLLVAITMIPLQTSFEELTIRGWLMQGINLMVRDKPWLSVIITSCIFGSLHFANPEVARYGLAKMMFYYISFGAFLAVITVLSDGLELALGIHTINNLYGSVAVTFTSSALQTNTIFRTPDPDINLMLLVSIPAMFACFFIFKNKFYFFEMERLWKTP